MVDRNALQQLFDRKKWQDTATSPRSQSNPTRDPHRSRMLGHEHSRHTERLSVINARTNRVHDYYVHQAYNVCDSTNNLSVVYLKNTETQSAKRGKGITALHRSFIKAFSLFVGKKN